VAVAALLVPFMLWLRPAAVWWALVALCAALVLAAELINTALERVLDGLHPERAEFVREAKDCAAGAVLVISLGSVLVFASMLFASLGDK
jgi:undecaprenol kinase